MSDFLKKVNAMQCGLKAPKDKKNSFGNYTYRSCESILEACKPLLKEHGLVLTIEDEIILIGTRFYVKSTSTLHDVETGEKLSSVGYARECESKRGLDDSQLTGSCSSYARKYSVCGLLCIDDNKDADTDEFTKQSRAGRQEEKKAPAPAPKYKQPELICENCGGAIHDHGKMDAQRIYDGTFNAYQMHLCWECSKLANQARTTGKENK